MISSFFHLHNSSYTFVGDSPKGNLFLLGKDAPIFFHALAKQMKVDGCFYIDEVDVFNENIRYGIISFTSSSHVLLSNGIDFENDDINAMVSTYSKEKGLDGINKDKLIRFSLDIYSVLKEKPLYLLLDLSNADIDLYPHLLYLISKLFPSYPLFILPRDYIRDELSISFSPNLNQINETKPFYMEDYKKAEEVGFKAFIDDICETKEVVPGTLFNEDKPKEETKEPSKPKEEKKPFKFNININISKEDKSDLANIAFSIVFFALAASTGPIYFAFSTPELGWMFTVTILMAIAFTFMSNVPTGYIVEDRKTFNFKKSKFFAFSSIFFPILSICYGIAFIFICKGKNFDASKYLFFGLIHICYPLFEGIVLGYTYYKLKKKSNKAK